MAIPDEYFNFTVDPHNGDAPAFQRFQSEYYLPDSNRFPNETVPVSPNFPPAPGVPSRYFLYYPYYVDITNDTPGGREVKIYDVTDGVLLTRTTGVTIADKQYRVSPVGSEQRNVIEFHPNQAGHEVAYDFYGEGGQLRAEDFNYIVFASDSVITNTDAEHVITRDYISDNITIGMNQVDYAAETSHYDSDTYAEIVNISGAGKAYINTEIVNLGYQYWDSNTPYVPGFKIYIDSVLVSTTLIDLDDKLIEFTTSLVIEATSGRNFLGTYGDFDKLEARAEVFYGLS